MTHISIAVYATKNLVAKKPYSSSLMMLHNIKLSLRQECIKHPHITPNKNDSNNHCSECKRIYKTRASFRGYFQQVYKMDLSAKRHRIFKNL